MPSCAEQLHCCVGYWENLRLTLDHRDGPSFPETSPPADVLPRSQGGGGAGRVHGGGGAGSGRSAARARRQGAAGASEGRAGGAGGRVGGDEARQVGEGASHETGGGARAARGEAGARRVRVRQPQAAAGRRGHAALAPVAAVPGEYAVRRGGGRARRRDARRPFGRGAFSLSVWPTGVSAVVVRSCGWLVDTPCRFRLGVWH